MKTYQEFLDICYQLDEIAPVPKGVTLYHKGGQPLSPEDRKSLENLSRMNREDKPKPKPKLEPVSPETPQRGPRARKRQDFVDMSNNTTQGKKGRRMINAGFEMELDEILMVSPAKKKPTTQKSKTKSTVEKPNPSDPDYVRKQRAYVKAKQLNNQFEVEESVRERLAQAIVATNPPEFSRRLKFARKLITSKALSDANQRAKKRVSGKAADPNFRRGPRARNSENS
jgi:hypothetical protein